jgi:cytochrome P450
VMEYYFLSEKDALCELTDDECVLNALNFIWGSIDSTRSTLVYSVLMFARTPETLITLREEVDRVAKDGLPNASQLASEMPQMQAFISEVLRCNPPFPVIPSELDEDITVSEGRVIPKGRVVWTSIYNAHHGSQFWGADSDQFRPERHLNSQVHNAAYVPFGGGSRRCPGERLGQFDVRYFLASLAKFFDFEVKNPDKARVAFLGSLQFASPLMVRVKSR